MAAGRTGDGRPGLRYLTFLSWKGMVTLEPPRRPEPARASASAAARSQSWKFGFVGSRDHDTGAVHLPPARVSFQGGAVDHMDPLPMADARGTVVTFTVDRLAYSPSPPIVFAVIDFDAEAGGGRLPMELTDVAATDVAIGDRVEMTFRRLNQADGVQNYFWKAKPVGAGESGGAGERRTLMSSHGIKDQVAIVGMGCTPFREHWDKGLDDLLLDATDECFASAGLAKADVDAYWLGTAQSGMSGITLAAPLKLEGKPVTRVENYCASGSEALRQAAYAVASGAYDVAMAVGVEKVKDSGYQGLNAFPIPNDGTARSLTAAAMFSLVVPAYAQRYGVDEDELKRVLARIAWKNHHNGARNPRAQFRKEMDLEVICNAAGRGRSPRRVRLRRGGRRLGRGHRGAGRGRPPLHRQAALHQGPVLRGRQRLGRDRPRLRLHDLPRGGRGRGRRLRPGRGDRPPPPAGHGRGARLLHPHRAGAHGGPGLLQPGRGLQGRRGRQSSTWRASCRSTPTAGSRASAIRWGRRGCACTSRTGSSCGARPPRTAAS